VIVSNGAGFNYLVDVLVNLDLNVVEFLCRFQYGLYVIIFTRYCLLKFVLLDSFYREKVVGTIFVDDADLKHFNMNKSETIEEAHAALQESICNWGWILIATGESLKPAKWFYHLMYFSWKTDGSWKYNDNEKHPELSVMVPLEDGTCATIKHLLVTVPTKTLGQMTCPTGSSDGAIVQMKENAQGWVDKAKSSKLNKCILTFLMDKQFWPGVAFGISSICAPFSELEDCLMRIYYEMLPMCGICRSVHWELRQLDRGYFGVGLPHPGVECFVAQVNKILMHYGCSSGLGIHMQVSMELLIIEGGVLCQVLSEPYSQHGRWVTHSWLWSL
jgi:hypothetical protein